MADDPDNIDPLTHARILDLSSAISTERSKSRINAEIPSLLSHYVLQEPARRRGRVVTFYSYKGGVGRSRALANVALLLALRGSSVLCVDFDLEAPGLSSYFSGEAFKWAVPEPDQHIGLVDFFRAYRDNLFTRITKTSIQWEQLVQTIEVTDRGVSFDFIGAGRQDRDYKQLISNFDWHSFYDHWDGGVLIERLKRGFVEKYNYVLVDSRTGITDISGLCSVHLPDILVAVFTPGPQSQAGLVDALQCIEANRRELRPQEPLHILPLPCRVDRDVVREAFDNWFNKLLNSYFAEKVLALRWPWHPDEYFRRVAIEYFSRFVYDDTIESLVHHVDDEAGNAWKYGNLIRVIDAAGPIEFSTLTMAHERSSAVTAWEAPTVLWETRK